MIIENDELLAEIESIGAQTVRLFDKKNKRELLHDANPAFWNRSSPILFPFVGACNGGAYTHEGKSYAMGQHGFARDTKFELVRSSAGYACCELSSNETTLAKYPFEFRLRVEVILAGRTVINRWTVVNTGDKEMLFQIGAHPAFLTCGHGFDDVELDLHTDKDPVNYRIEDPGSGCCYDVAHATGTDGGVFKLSADVFDKGVYIFEDADLTNVTMKVCGRPVISVDFPGFPFFGVWSKKGAPFVCLEPWYGRTDSLGFKGELKDRKGEMQLPAGETFRASYSIIVH